MRFLYDTSVFVYARGAEHEYREPCRAVVRLAGQGVLAGEASVELVQEYAHILRRRGLGGADVREQARDVAALCLLHDFAEEDLRLALNLMATHEKLRVRDAVHAATALRRGISVILSADHDFDGIAGLERLDPLDAVRRLVPGPRAGN
ncbi:MAG: type II toxin-antitoxin system VapC family toxin [Candidatus Limnocylindria bacterium]